MADSELINLMKRYQEGEPAAFEGLYRLLKPRLLSYLVSLSLNRSLAEDLLQETFMQFHRSRATYLTGRPVLPWAFSIARHVYLMDRRKRLRHRMREVDVEETPELPVPPEAEDLGKYDSLRKALAQLPKKQLEAILLNQVWGFTFKEIAGTIGVRTVTAKVRAHRGMKRLREILSG